MNAVQITVPMSVKAHVAPSIEGFGIRLHITGGSVGVWYGQGGVDRGAPAGARVVPGKGFQWYAREEAEAEMKELCRLCPEIVNEKPVAP